MAKSKSMHDRYSNVTPIGTVALCNYGGIALFNPDEIDSCKDNCDFIAAWFDGEKYSSFHKHKVYYTSLDRGYIRKGKGRIYLDWIMYNHSA